VPRQTVRRLAWTTQLPAVVLGGLAGAACGLVGAAVSMPIVPLFAQAPGVDTLDLATPWTPVVTVVAAVLAVLVAGSTLLGWSVFRRVALERLRETA
jgi:nitrate/nitrite transporter NarK